MSTQFNTNIIQATGVKVFYRVPSMNVKKPSPVLRSFYVDTLDVVEAEQTVMEELFNNQEVWLKPMLTLVSGGKS